MHVQSVSHDVMALPHMVLTQAAHPAPAASDAANAAKLAST
jgi:hypothetical protein